jgi:sec-independent protein translocase protein TatA
MGIGNPIHIMFIAAIALIVLGPKRLPELARSLGHGMREFRDSMSEAAGGGEHADAPAAVPGQAQLMAPSQPAAAAPAQPARTFPESTPVSSQSAAVSSGSVASSEPVLDPAQPVPSGDAPDSRSL